MQLIDKTIRFLFGALIFLVPLIILPMTSELFEFNKILLIYIVTILIGFFWILEMILSKKIIFKKNLFGFILILFFLSQVASTFFSMDIHSSLFGYYGRFNGGLVSILCYLILYFAFISLMDRQFVFKLLKISLFSSLIVILWGLPGRFNHDLTCLLFTHRFDNSCWTNQFQPAVRMFSTLGQPNWLGAYLAVNFFIGLYFFMETKKHENIKTFFNSIYLLLNFSAILFTRSRSSLAAVGISLGLFFIYLIISKKENLQKFLILFLYLFVCVVVFKTGIDKVDNYLKFPISKQITNHKSQISSSEVTESFDIRKIVWKGAVDLGLKYPLFGTGVETFAYSYYFTRPVEHNFTSEWDYLYNKAHNEYLNYFATTGFLGLGLYLLLIFNFQFSIFNQFLNSKFQNKNLLLIACLFLSYLTILITNFFGFSVTSISLYFYLIPAFAAFLISTYEVKRGPAGQSTEIAFSKKLNLRQEFSIIFLAIIALFLLFSTVSYFLADVKYAKAENYLRSSNYQVESQLLFEALKLRGEHTYEDKLSYSLANLAFMVSYGKQPELAKKLIAMSQYYNTDTLNQVPKNVLYWKTQAKNSYLFFETTSDKKYLGMGIDVLKKAQELSPTDPKIPYSLAIYYSLLFDEVKDQTLKKEYKKISLDLINQALKLKPNLPDSIELKKQLESKFKVTK